ncbi:involucrin-like [Hoplias malabaricus]|uniref:involucrin-like n=1 Tax=Hoplias malabaricus TaxID=27720 RepID=UPI003462D12D
MSTRAACASSRWGLLLLLLLLATCLRFGGAEDEALPLSLVDLVMNSPISSMQDLQRLLDVDSVEEEEEEVHSNGTHKRLPRSLAGVQVAQQAMCKVRTEVMEVTRAMLDRRNANFLLWPLCVEVQRCSGCCNTRTLQCVPVAVKTRHLQMTKIQFINRQPVYEKVIIPVEDHVSCSCQSHASAHVPQAKATPPPPPPRLPPKSVPPKTQSKEELHRHDDLKQNQRFHLDEPETQEAQWQSKYTLSHKQGAPARTLTHTQGYRPSPVQHTLTHTPAGPSYVSVEDVITRKTTLGVSHLLSDTTQHFTLQEEVKDPHTQQDGVKDHHTLPEELPEHRIHLGSGDDQVKVQHQPTEHHRHHHHHHHQLHDKATSPQPRHKPIHDSSQSEVTLHHSSQLEAPILSYSHVEVIGQSSGQTELPDHHSGQSATPSFHRSQSETPNQRHHHSQSDRSEHHLDGMEREIYHHHHQHHIPHLHVTQATTLHQSSTAKAVMDAPPATVPVPQTPPPTVLQRRRRRKHRRRMSKSAMRAMIMVMS